MELTKAQALKDSSIRDQQALVKKTLKAPTKTVRYDIPGAKSLMTSDSPQLEREEFLDSVYTWLRYMTNFKAVTLNFAEDLSQLKTTKITINDFPVSPEGYPIWETHPKQKLYLAEQITNAIFSSKNVAAVEVSEKNISIYRSEDTSFGPSHHNWCPHMIFAPNFKVKGEYKIYR